MIRHAPCTAKAQASWSGCPPSYGWVITATQPSSASESVRVRAAKCSTAAWSLSSRLRRSGLTPNAASAASNSAARASA
jgi:hypothetical protein